MKYLNLFLALSALALTGFTKVDADLQYFDSEVLRLKTEFEAISKKPHLEWTQKSLVYMESVDQWVREAVQKWPKQKLYTVEEAAYFQEQMNPRWLRIDTANAEAVKDLLRTYDWFRIGKFGADADARGWLIAQHADHDPAFQKSVLKILLKMVTLGETAPKNVAYLDDRIAASWKNPCGMRPQKYGTQGRCIGPGKWEPIPIVEPIERLDERRKEMGLGPMIDYQAIMDKICSDTTVPETE